MIIASFRSMTRRAVASTKQVLVVTCAVLALVICFNGCSTIPKITAQGAVAGHHISGPVDSDVARRYLAGETLPSDLELARHRLLAEQRTPSRGELADIAQRFSPDVATLLFIEAVSAQPHNQDLRQRFDVEVETLRREGIEGAHPDVPEDLLVLLVPGWFYETHGRDSGADLARQRRLLDRMGVAHRLVEVDENGTVADNARVVATAVRRESESHSLLIVSASKGSAEVAVALGRELSVEDTRSIVGWLSIGGVVRGTPFADRVLEPDLCWFASLKLGLDGFDLDGAKSLQTGPARETFDSLHLPRHVPIVSYVAAPLSGHVTSRGAFGYARLRSSGPNDGLTLLADEVIPGASVLLAPAVDHFFQHESQDIWTVALLRVLTGSSKRLPISGIDGSESRSCQCDGAAAAVGLPGHADRLGGAR